MENLLYPALSKLDQIPSNGLPKVSLNFLVLPVCAALVSIKFTFPNMRAGPFNVF